jgi:hypothetical protein
MAAEFPSSIGESSTRKEKASRLPLGTHCESSGGTGRWALTLGTSHTHAQCHIQFIAEEHHTYHDEDAFWNVFSNENGIKFSYQQILDRLAERRMSAAVNDANDARAFFGGNLDNPLANGAFRYTKSGKTYLSSKDDAIAKKWRTLLTSRPDIAEHWAYFKAKLPLQTTS